MSSDKVPAMAEMSFGSGNLTDDIAEGNRRAHQFLRLLEMDPMEAAKFLVSLPTKTPIPFLVVGMCLKFIARGISQHRPEEERAKLGEHLEVLDSEVRAQARVGVTGELLTAVHEMAKETRRAVAKQYPDREQRIKFYEAGARIAYEGQEPESPFRKLF